MALAILIYNVFYLMTMFYQRKDYYKKLLWIFIISSELKSKLALLKKPKKQITKQKQKQYERFDGDDNDNDVKKTDN